MEKVLKSFDFRTFFQQCILFCGGDKRDRTADLLNAIQALSQVVVYMPPFVSNEVETPPKAKKFVLFKASAAFDGHFILFSCQLL